jgi:hypothetical protein
MKGRNLVEFSAIPVVVVILGMLAVIMVAFDVGAWAWLVVGATVVVVAAVVVWLVSAMHRHPASFAAPSVPPRAVGGDGSATHRVLVVADDCATSDAFVSTIVEHAAGRPVEAFVVAPALSSRFARLTSDDGAYAEAQRHLDATLDALARAGIAARGHIGSHDPIQAADDGLREFPAHEVVFATHPPEEASRLEADAVDVARARYEVLVTHLVVART